MSVPELPTRPYLPNGLSTPPDAKKKKPTHCAIGGVAAGSQFAVELAHLLHRRLRVASLIAFAPTLLFLGANLLQGALQLPNGPAILTVHAIVTVLVGLLAGVVWLSPPMSLCRLRKIELTLFITLGLFFGFL